MQEIHELYFEMRYRRELIRAGEDADGLELRLPNKSALKHS